jgi:hypothetical protein
LFKKDPKIAWYKGRQFVCENSVLVAQHVCLLKGEEESESFCTSRCFSRCFAAVSCASLTSCIPPLFDVTKTEYGAILVPRKKKKK